MIPHPSSLAGTSQPFGAVGPVFEIIAAGAELPGGDRMMRVRVIESVKNLHTAPSDARQAR